MTKSTVVVLVLALTVLSVFYVWDFLAGEQERWLHYSNPEQPVILGEYGSYEECSQHMNSREAPSGCRRIDGPYNALNKLADFVL